jgi:hypothetical protein
MGNFELGDFKFNETSRSLKERMLTFCYAVHMEWILQGIEEVMDLTMPRCWARE